VKNSEKEGESAARCKLYFYCPQLVPFVCPSQHFPFAKIIGSGTSPFPFAKSQIGDHRTRIQNQNQKPKPKPKRKPKPNSQKPFQP